MSVLHLDLGERGYDIHIGRGLILKAGELFNLNRSVFILTDSGVPAEYAQGVLAQTKRGTVFTVECGEGAKSPEVYSAALGEMIKFGLTRSDCVVAVGGGVVGDLAGFLAATYMRGVDFYNIPTTVLSQVDSSIGGKVAINVGGVKNIAGAFHQPRGVIVDPEVLKTLPKRQISNGLAESVKMALTSDKELFEMIEAEDINDDNIEEIITRSLKIKKAVVESDERESGLRKILNFGHTLGHGIEAEEQMRGMYHGECVALGMTAVCSPEVRVRLTSVLKRLGLPTEYQGDLEKALSFVVHDKKCDGGRISAILVSEVGKSKIVMMSTEEFCDTVRVALSAK